jgi:hypothetical protein
MIVSDFDTLLFHSIINGLRKRVRELPTVILKPYVTIPIQKLIVHKV